MNNLEQHFLANKFANIWTFAMPYTGWSLPIKKSTKYETNNYLFFMVLLSLVNKWSMDNAMASIKRQHKNRQDTKNLRTYYGYNNVLLTVSKHPTEFPFVSP